MKNVKTVNYGEVKNKDVDKHVKEPSTFTEKEILNAFSVVRNGWRQHVNIPNEMFIKLTEVKTFYEKTTICKNNKEMKLTDYFN